MLTSYMYIHNNTQCSGIKGAIQHKVVNNNRKVPRPEAHKTLNCTFTDNT